MSAGQREREGFTLIGVLVFCVILIPVVASLAQASRDSAFVVRSDLDEFKLEFYASGFAEVVAAQLGSNNRLFEQVNGRWLVCTAQGKAIAITARDHDGKIDLNNASSELLVAGFEAAGFDNGKAKLLQQYVEASRSNGQVPRDVSELAAKISLKHAPFEHVDELQDVLSLLESPATDLERLFTVNTGVANIEESTSAPELKPRLRALANRTVVFENNRGFDYVDVRIHLRSMSSSNEVAISRTFRRISPAGDVVAVRTMRLPSKWSFSMEQQTDCKRLLGLGGEA